MQGKENRGTLPRFRLMSWVWGLAIAWTLCVLFSLGWNIHHARGLIVDQARIEARANFNKDLLFRRWAARHGGVYALVSDYAPRDPYLAHLPDRDGVTADGKPLTLLNPAFMQRQILEMAKEAYGVSGHISSLNPLSPSNRPDPWEEESLRAFARGEQEASLVDSLDGGNHLRLMRPMKADASCLKCHAREGYQVGKLVGGISVSIPMAPYEQLAGQQVRAASLGHGLLWLIGLAGILGGARSIRQRLVERNLAEQQLFHEKERAQVTLHSIADGVITANAAGRVEYVNPAAREMTGWTEAEAHGRPLDEVLALSSEATGESLSILRADGSLIPAGQYVLLRHDGTQVPVEGAAARIHDRHGEVAGLVMVFHDVSQARQLTERLTHQATHDPLTGLVNRAEFETRLRHAILSAQESGEHHALFYVDLDQFKVVNDTCGHVAGDELLKQLAYLLGERVRDSDTLARLGGDEFGVLLEHCPVDRAAQIAEGLCQTIKEFRFVWEGRVFEIGASIGVVGVDAESGGLSDILSAADLACYEAKERGRNRIHLYRPGEEAFRLRHGDMLWATRIRQALDHGRFLLVYQRIVPVDPEEAGCCERYEVLVRMIGEGGEWIPPGAFIPAAERYNLMPALDRWVIRQLFTIEAKRYNELRQQCLLQYGRCGCLFNVNLSGASLNDDRFLDFVRGELAASHIPPGLICFEITETAAIANLSRVSRFMRELKSETGCSFALDDFGSGMSSFAYLKNLPVEFLKIDGNFVKDMRHDPIDRAMVEAINNIGQVMGIKTIAEFVENQETLELLRALGVDYVQGFGIDRPKPFEEIDQWQEGGGQP